MKNLTQTDPRLAELIEGERHRQQDVVRLIPSENYASSAVQEAAASALDNKYSEGYPKARYYQGQEFIDRIEMLAQERARELFGAEHVNVQPYSGSPANLAVYLGLVGTSGTVMGQDLAAGGHLTHGAKVSATGRYYNSVQYGLNRETELIDFDQVAALAREHRPKLIVAGCTAFPRLVDFDRFAEIAAEVGAYLLADISHISGLCATGFHPSPVPVADAVVTTTHKILRGPRGGMILCKKAVAPKIDKAVFPGLQGGPHNSAIAAIAVALKEASGPEYVDYCRQVVANAKALAEGLKANGLSLVTGGTDNHLVLVDATAKGVPGKPFAEALEAAGIVCNYNKIPFDPRPANDPSGVRMGTPAITSRGMKEAEMTILAGQIAKVADNIEDPAALASIADEIRELCSGFPAPGIND